MTSSELTVKSFSFNKDDLRILYSIINLALKNEACKSNSFSRVRKFFQAEETNFEEVKRYRESKLNWINEWKMQVCSLIDIGDVYSESDLQFKIKIEPIDGLAMKNEYCNWCKKNVHIAFEIRNGMLVNLKVQ